MLLEAGFMALPILVAIGYQEEIKYINSFALSMSSLLILGLPLARTRAVEENFSIKDGYVLVSLSWIILSIFGALPYYLSEAIPSFTDALFESVSGFTTAGASVLLDAEAFPRSMHFWRSFTQFIGGMGILVFALTFMDANTKGALNIMRAEVPGPETGKVVSKVGPTAKILYLTYISITLVSSLALVGAGMSLFDALIHAMGASSTGGFSNRNESIGYYENPAVDIIILVSMFLSGINFNVYYLMFIGRAKQILKSEELSFYIKAIVTSIGLILITTLESGDNVLVQLKDATFSVVSLVTTTGYTTIDYTRWPLFANVILLFLLLAGGCTGSTAGGLKMLRVTTLIKSGVRGVRKAVNPRRVMTITESKRHVTDDKLESNQAYLVIYGLVFGAVLILISLGEQNFDTAFSLTLTAVNNNAPSFAGVRPGTNYASYSAYIKLVSSAAMIFGRLEIIPLVVLLSPETYKKR